MAQYPKMTITNAGLDMIGESAADAKPLIFTKARLGDGSISTEVIAEMTALIAEKMQVALTSGTKMDNGQTKLRFAVSNSQLDNGFFAREIGLYAKVGEDGTEALYAYTNGGNYVDYIPDKTNPVDAQIVDIYVVTANAASIQILVESSIYVTVQDMVDHNTGADSHPNGLTHPLMDWVASYLYKVGDVRVYNKKIWRCKTANFDTVFDEAKWDLLGGGDYLPLAGGTMTGAVGFDGTTKTLSVTGDDVTWGGKEIKSMAFPSSTSIEITSSFSANGATYTAPANGYINAQGATSGVNSTNAGYIMLTNSIGMKTFSGSDYTQLLHIYLPVKKGETVTLNFLRSVINKTLFIYAEGEV